MALHFSEQELAERRKRTCAEMAERGLDGLLIFRQESMFYLSGYDTFGYVYFQCLLLSADGAMTLLTRAADLRQARHTSVIEDIRIWVDGPDADPARELAQILDGHGLKGKRLGVEWDSYGLTALNGQKLSAALDGFCTLENASDLVTRLRLVKSPAEIAYVRRAAELADDALDAAVALAGPGAFEGDILAAMQSAVFRGGGDDPANETIIGSGPDALLCRYFTGRRHLDPADQLTLEWAGVYRHYHACMIRTISIGPPPDRQLALYDAAREALEAVTAALVPGRPVGEAFDAHATVLDRHGLAAHRLNACGYSLGTTFAPNWMDWPMLYHGNPVLAAPDMVFFLHMIIFDSDAGVAMTLGETVRVTDTTPERLSRSSLDMIRK
ncbi:MAG: aminopeptidase P family protein [Rhodospirillaceae bacterium]|nr:aminopeptidase P family protein [Rhodospirillaceae bacterium]MBT5243555.1 aminopeptidase P family protein [Rhodospirillaceae bacterium]MBT5562143.1 aminopeptidase P family protein [Rhodospirillaceae bacterium]MBT6242316.1 aminopeptidase P family protein [Rhodospirillaceae bacterium]MBT7137672.1 aminopeptidase P family protein [Rhodospirillaceae bacterium]